MGVRLVVSGRNKDVQEALMDLFFGTKPDTKFEEVAQMLSSNVANRIVSESYHLNIQVGGDDGV